LLGAGRTDKKAEREKQRENSEQVFLIGFDDIPL
jgi:hypothetical protein